MALSLTRETFGRWLARLGVLLAAATLAACGGGGGGGGGTGTLRVAMTDAPSCGYDHVYITVEKVRVHTSATAEDSAGGWQEIVLSPARRIDLLDLTNGVLEELGSTPLPAGNYQQVRLVLASNTGNNQLANAVDLTGDGEGPIALTTPSAAQSGLKLQAHFTVEANQLADLVLDFDACKSVVKAGKSGKYILKPVISVTKRLSTAIQGFVTTTLTLGSTTVSAQQDGTVVRSTVPDSSGKFVLAFLPEGSYDVVVTSEGRATAVITGVPVTISAGLTTVTGTVSAIVPPLSSMANVTGTTSVTTGTGTATVSTLVTDATVSALQTLTGGPTILVDSTQVDAELATYLLRLPTDAPIKSAYSTSGPSFTADTDVAGEYTLRASSPTVGLPDVTMDVTITGDATHDLVWVAP